MVKCSYAKKWMHLMPFVKISMIYYRPKNVVEIIKLLQGNIGKKVFVILGWGKISFNTENVREDSISKWEHTQVLGIRLSDMLEGDTVQPLTKGVVHKLGCFVFTGNGRLICT